jgi:aromatic ring-opening dioxygenase catalytic subunit (LigB family)
VAGWNACSRAHLAGSLWCIAKSRHGHYNHIYEATQEIRLSARIKELILSGDHNAIIDYAKLGRSARLAAPALDHYLPLLYALGAQEKGHNVTRVKDSGQR